VDLAFGTILGEKPAVWNAAAEACRRLDLQLVISHGQRNAKTGVALPGNPIVVDYAPQFDLLQRTSAFITHGGLNSTLEAIAHGVPMIAIPFVQDAPGIVSRIVRPCGWKRDQRRSLAGRVVPCPRRAGIPDKRAAAGGAAPEDRRSGSRGRDHRAGGRDPPAGHLERGLSTGC
jgi:hypothetical protein